MSEEEVEYEFVDEESENQAPAVNAEQQIKAAERLLAIIEAKDSLVKFTKLCFPHISDPDDVGISRYDDQLHHRIIGEALEAVERKEIPRLIITMPPRAGKSELACKKFIPWALGRNPYRQVIFATYNETFAEDTGRSARSCMELDIFSQVFNGCGLRPGAKAASRLETNEGGIAAFVGVGGSITGRGADLLIIDDPIKDREQADSALERQKQWDWFNDVAMTRLMDHSSCVIIIMTRWHEDDIVGRLVDPENECYNAKEAEKWKILSIPAIAEENDALGRQIGESIWPKKFPVEYFEEIRARSARTFASLYQGRPNPEDGDFFVKEYFHEYKPDDLPNNLRMYCASDHAVSTKQESDFTCLIPVGVCEKGIIWVLPEVWWHKKDTLAVVDAMLMLIKIYRPIFWWAENGHISKSIGPFLRERMMEENSYCAIIEVTPAKDKQTRAQSIQGRMAQGMVRFPAGAPWWERAKAEMLKFPASTHDDFVDALSWIGLGLSLQVPAQKEAKKEEKYESGTIGWLLQQSRFDEEQRKLQNI